MMSRFFNLFKIGITLTALSVFSTSHAETSSLKMIWWNIHEGRTRTDSTITDFNQSLASLLGSNHSPDVILMGEYSDQAFTPALLKSLETIFPYHQLFSYDSSSTDGVAVWSKIRYDVVSVRPLDFTPANLTDSEKVDYRLKWCGRSDDCIRPYVHLSLKPNGNTGKTYEVVATHINDFWRNSLNPGSSNRAAKALQTLIEVCAGEDNPLWYQLVQFREALEKDFRDRLTKTPLLIVGDFNMPTDVPFTLIKTLGYRKISYDLINAMPTTPTFPTAGATEAATIPKIAIDHAFINPEISVLNSQVLPLVGSHHYPLYLEIK
jgi:endonuclease/exonuclease/phosphatase family metal-dependent hydrolase